MFALGFFTGVAVAIPLAFAGFLLLDRHAQRCAHKDTP